jgi:hypothetical protein
VGRFVHGEVGTQRRNNILLTDTLTRELSESANYNQLQNEEAQNWICQIWMYDAWLRGYVMIIMNQMYVLIINKILPYVTIIMMSL